MCNFVCNCLCVIVVCVCRVIQIVYIQLLYVTRYVSRIVIDLCVHSHDHWICRQYINMWFTCWCIDDRSSDMDTSSWVCWVLSVLSLHLVWVVTMYCRCWWRWMTDGGDCRLILLRTVAFERLMIWGSIQFSLPHKTIKNVKKYGKRQYLGNIEIWFSEKLGKWKRENWTLSIKNTNIVAIYKWMYSFHTLKR